MALFGKPVPEFHELKLHCGGLNMLGPWEVLLLGGGALLKKCVIAQVEHFFFFKKEQTFQHHNKENTEETEKALVKMFTDFLRNESLS